MDRIAFARRIAGWLTISALAVWVSGPAALLALPQHSRCVDGVISCEAMAGMIQAAVAVLAAALLAAVLLVVCRRRISDAGLSGPWLLLGAVPSLLVCREITAGALTSDAVRALVAGWPEPAVGAPVHLAAALAVAAIIGLLPGVRRTPAA